ncbi:recombinase family protein [Aeribacillus composti]|nr:recombinase family protein [Aeribacillus composti]
MTNPHYVGDLVQGGTTTVSVTSKRRKNVPKEKQFIVKNAHEPIISNV